MIRGRHLFGRDAISPNEKKMVQAANKTALKMFKGRFNSPLRENWSVPVEEVTLEDVEMDVIRAVSDKYKLNRNLS